MKDAINQINDLENMLEIAERGLLSQVSILKEAIANKVLRENNNSEASEEDEGSQDVKQEQGVDKSRIRH